MGGKTNKKRRKQERLRQRRSGGDLAGGAAPGDLCPLYRNPPGGMFYSSWLDCGTLKETTVWAKVVLASPAGTDPDVHDLARRMPFLASIYGRKIPAEAACYLDQCLDRGSLPVQWAEDDPIIMVPVAEMAPPLTSGSAAEARVAIHDLHARGLLMVADDGTIIPLIPAELASMV